MRSASLYTHGCRLNQAETQVLREQLERAGYRVVPFGERADVGIINTCTVTREAEAKCRQTVRRFIRANPGAFTAVIGCYSQTGAEAIASIPGVDLIVGNGDKDAVLDHVGLGKSERPVILRERISREDFSVRFVGEQPSDRRANLKVQDGCDFMCAFCIIPFARGRARSRDWDNLLAEARTLAANGVREVVLTGVNIGTYNSGGAGIVGLVDALDGLGGIARIRISSIEPTTVPEGLLERMADPGHALLPFLHLPLQSGSDRVLARMGRRYGAEDYRAFAHRAAARVPDLCLGTDLLVGHPGEDGAAFEETCQFFADGPFAYAHVFTYSEREGTAALRQGGTVPVEERRRRGAVLRRLGERARARFYRRFLGRALPVLFENPQGGEWSGYTSNYIRVRASPPPGWPGPDLTNRITPVRLDALAADFVRGEVVSPGPVALSVGVGRSSTRHTKSHEKDARAV